MVSFYYLEPSVTKKKKNALTKTEKLLQLTALSNPFDLLNISVLDLSLKENRGRLFLN